MYERSPLSVLRTNDFLVPATTPTAYGQYYPIVGRSFPFPSYGNPGGLPSGGKTMNFWHSRLGKVIWQSWAILLGMKLFAKLTCLVIWASIRHPLSDSIIDYEREIVHLKKKE
jgi:hypothetical protein